MRHFFQSASFSALDTETQPFIQLWIYRVLTQLGGAKEFVGSHGFDNDAIAELIGMGHHIDGDNSDLEKLFLQEKDSDFKPATIRR